MTILNQKTSNSNPATSEHQPKDNQRQRILIFLCVVLGILARWFWTVGWPYVQDPSLGLHLGPPLAIITRIGLAFVAASLTFVSSYDMINRMHKEPWQIYFYAFGCGFMWQLILGFEIQQT